MKNKSFSLQGVVLVALACLILALSGCGRKEETTTPPPEPPRKVKVVTEFRSPETGEELRVHTFAEDGVTEVETRIDYRDGRSETFYFRHDGTTRAMKEEYARTRVVKRQVEYEADGKTVSSERRYRGTGTLEFVSRRLPGDITETTRYRVDGKRLHSVERKAQDGSFETTFYRKDGTSLWAKAKSLNATDTQVEYFDDKGQLDVIRVNKSSGGSQSTFEVTKVRPDGTAAYKQSWSGWSSPYYRRFDLKTLEEFESDGKTLKRKVTMQYDGRTPNEVVSYENGVKKSVRTYRWDGTLQKEEFYEPAGTLKETKEHDQSEGIREEIDPVLVTEPAAGDPLQLLPQDFQ